MSKNNLPEVAVVHLIWLPFGIDLFKEFIVSYKQYSSGYRHKLVLLFNGVKAEEELIPYHEFAKDQEVIYESFYLQKGWDLEAYRWVASKIEAKYILFLNSYCRFMNDNWLAHFVKATTLPDVGIVGATGTYHSIFSMILYETKMKWENGKSFKENFRKYKLLFKNFFLYRFWFAPFPNPHIRTNSFLIERNLFQNLSFIPIKKKYDAYRLESGRNGFTRQILKSGYKPVVIDKNGRVYEMNQWKESHTFWIADQENLLIKDNQTEMYQNAAPEYKRFLTYLCWGNHG